MTKDAITLLASGNSLGAYIPAIHLREYLARQHIRAEVQVLETLYREETRSKINGYKKAFHNNFSIALTGHRLAKDISPNLDDSAVRRLHAHWRQTGCATFIAFTGFWLPILKAYKEIAGFPVHIEWIHMDACDTPSYKVYKYSYHQYRNVQFYDPELESPGYLITPPDVEAASFEARNDRFLIHGGGWGIGTYRDKIERLRRGGCRLDIIAYDESEVQEDDGKTRYFMVDPEWSPWIKDAGEIHTYPPMLELVRRKGMVERRRLPDYASYLELVRLSRAIVSKPGGATLNDSLVYATPLLLLEPFGYHEESNATFWKRCGFGIGYDDWEENGFPAASLQACHERLRKQRITACHYGREFDTAPKERYV